MKKLDILINLISDTLSFFKQQVQKQVNIGLTLCNWLFGFYIVEYELNGSDRAKYGTRLYKEIEKRLKTIGVLQIRERHLYLCKDFYLAYPNILRSAIAKSYLINFKQLNSLESAVTKMNRTDDKSMIEIEKLINQLRFKLKISIPWLEKLVRQNILLPNQYQKLLPNHEEIAKKLTILLGNN